MVISKSSLGIEKKDKSSVREILKREFGRLLGNLKKEIQVKNNQTTTKETISDNKSQSKQEIGKQNSSKNISNTRNKDNIGETHLHEQHNRRMESNNIKLGVDRELEGEFDKLNIDPLSLGTLVKEGFRNSYGEGTMTKFEFNQAERTDENGHKYVEINGTKFYRLEQKDKGILYKGEFISNEDLKHRTDIMHTYTKLERQAWGENFSTVEIGLQRGLCSSGIQFTGTGIWKTNWNLLTDKNGNLGVHCKNIWHNETKIL